jgi:hypothetical protein
LSASASFSYSLTAGAVYYVKIDAASGTGEYEFSLQPAPSAEVAAFDVYAFDVELANYRQIVEDIYYEVSYSEGAVAGAALCEVYERIVADDAKLHKLPEFLQDHPKNLPNFDTLLNNYYRAKHADFAAIEARYLAIIEEYQEYLPEGDYWEIGGMGGGQRAPVIRLDSAEASEAEAFAQADSVGAQAAASMTITGTTATSIAYNVTFPTSGAFGNVIFLYDFNTNDGLTKWESVYTVAGGGVDYYRTNGTFTINGLVSGGVYVLAMMWSTDGGAHYGGANAVHRRVKLPCRFLPIFSNCFAALGSSQCRTRRGRVLIEIP